MIEPAWVLFLVPMVCIVFAAASLLFSHGMYDE